MLRLVFRRSDVFFLRPTGQYVRDSYSILSNMAHVYHIVVVRVICTSWAHVWRLRFRFLGMGMTSGIGGMLTIGCQPN
jgi:hypothetical protein